MNKPKPWPRETHKLIEKIMEDCTDIMALFHSALCSPRNKWMARVVFDESISRVIRIDSNARMLMNFYKSKPSGRKPKWYTISESIWILAEESKKAMLTLDRAIATSELLYASEIFRTVQKKGIKRMLEIIAEHPPVLSDQPDISRVLYEKVKTEEVF